jgi:hypothetical protein
MSVWRAWNLVPGIGAALGVFRESFSMGGLGTQRGNCVEGNGLTSMVELDTFVEVR